MYFVLKPEASYEYDKKRANNRASKCQLFAVNYS